MQEATSNMMREGGDSGVGALQKVTMGYNMARLQEATGDLNAARAGYMVQSIAVHVVRCCFFCNCA